VATINLATRGENVQPCGRKVRLQIQNKRASRGLSAPLILDDGSCIGSLCLIDIRPRFLAEPDLARLHDLADVAVRELDGMNAIRPARPYLVTLKAH
jgi:hypothetical protein